MVDPKNFSRDQLRRPRRTDVCIIPPNSFALAHTVEYFRIPRDILVICLGKTTYARCGIIVNVTPLEPEWEGQVTIEISNTTPLPARIYANEGICQFLFLQGNEPCETSATPTRPANTCASAASRCRETVADGRDMDRIRIRGGRPLKGEIAIGGAKNAALPLMAAGLLTDEPLTLTNVPRLADIATMAALLAQHGIAVERDRRRPAHARRSAAPITNTEAPYDIVRKMRASVLVLGPLLARCGEARVSLPGGCAIGARPVDLHLKGLRADGRRDRARGRLHRRHGARRAAAAPRIVFPQVSVGATENLLMAAALAKGRPCSTTPRASRRSATSPPAWWPWARGSTGIGTDRLVIEGVRRLHGATHAIMPDRIETGTYAMRRRASPAARCGCAAAGSSISARWPRSLREAGVEIDRAAGRRCAVARG